MIATALRLGLATAACALALVLALAFAAPASAAAPDLAPATAKASMVACHGSQPFPRARRLGGFAQRAYGDLLYPGPDPTPRRLEIADPAPARFTGAKLKAQETRGLLLALRDPAVLGRR